jgi:hypothetical protein
MKRTGVVALVALATGVITVVASVLVFFFFHTTVLERSDVWDFHLAEIRNGGVSAIRISGFCRHSASSVKDISVRRIDSAQVVTVRVFLARRGTTGDIQIDVPVPDGVNEVRFGQRQVVIWRRQSRLSEQY